MRNTNTRTKRIAATLIAFLLILSSITATSFHLGGGYSYTKLDYTFDSPLDGERISGKGIEHEATLNTATYLGRNDNFGLGLDLNFRIPMRNSYEGVETDPLPWGIGANLSMISRTPFIRSGNFGMHTKIGAGITYRNSDAGSYPVIRTGAEKIRDMDVRLLTGIGFYGDIAERVSITAGIDFNISLMRMYKVSGTDGDESFKSTKWQPFDNVSGHETRGYVAISYIFTKRG